MPVNSTKKTMWEDQAHAVYVLDPDTGEPWNITTEVTIATSPIPAATNHIHVPAVNAAATITLAAPGAGKHWLISSVEWSYDATPTGGQLSITDAGTRAFFVYVKEGGPGFFQWEPVKQFSANAPVVISLTAGGAAISGSVNVHAWVE